MSIDPMSPRRRASGKLGAKITQLSEWLNQHRKIVVNVALALFLFDWYELRPVRINQACADQASANAKILLQNKAKITTDPTQKKSYEGMASKNMYLRTDYESFYKKCQRDHGREV